MASKGDSSVAVRVKLSHGAERALSDLQSRREQVKRKAMLDLRAAVEMEARQMSRENFSAFITELNRRIFDLVKSEDPHEQLGGIFAMDALVDVECEESPTLITRFANYLRLILPCNNVPTMVMASRVLGHLAQAGGTLTADFVEFEVKRALEGLNAEKRSEHHRLAAVLVCKQLALNAPTLFFMHVPAYIKAVWAGIHDAKQLIREATIESLRACLGIIAQRDMAVRSKWFSIIFDEAERGQRALAVPVVHGSLLVVGELLQVPQKSPDKQSHEQQTSMTNCPTQRLTATDCCSCRRCSRRRCPRASRSSRSMPHSFASGNTATRCCVRRSSHCSPLLRKWTLARSESNSPPTPSST
jgi:hypothetical protein